MLRGNNSEMVTSPRLACVLRELGKSFLSDCFNSNLSFLRGKTSKSAISNVGHTETSWTMLGSLILYLSISESSLFLSIRPFQFLQVFTQKSSSKITSLKSGSGDSYYG